MSDGMFLWTVWVRVLAVSPHRILLTPSLLVKGECGRGSAGAGPALPISSQTLGSYQHLSTHQCTAQQCEGSCGEMNSRPKTVRNKSCQTNFLLWEDKRFVDRAEAVDAVCLHFSDVSDNVSPDTIIIRKKILAGLNYYEMDKEMAGNLYSSHMEENKGCLLGQRMPSHWKEARPLGRVRIPNEFNNLHIQSETPKMTSGNNWIISSSAEKEQWWRIR